MRLKLVALLLAALIAPQSVNARNLSGNELYEACTDDNFQMFCTAYVVGTVEGLNRGVVVTFLYVIPAAESSASDPADAEDLAPDILEACIPKDASYVQLRDVVIAYLKKRPEYRHKAANELILTAMQDNFPCFG